MSSIGAKKVIEFFSAKSMDQLVAGAEGPRPEKMEVSFKAEADTDPAKNAFYNATALIMAHIRSAAFNFEDCGLHIGVFEFDAGVSTPLHSHSDNCVYYVERGSLVMGNREIVAGEGFLTRANQPYAFTVGPDGARILEFTKGRRTDVLIHDRNVVGWKTRLEQAFVKKVD